MIQNTKNLLSDFNDAFRNLYRLTLDIEYESQKAPHQPHILPDHKCAVYVFSLSENYGNSCPAGANRVLKVGKVGSNSSPRFQYQHYNYRSAGSNLSKSIIDSKILWPYLGITELQINHVSNWIKENVDRDHFYLNSGDLSQLDDLELYFKGRLGPVFEGG